MDDAFDYSTNFPAVGADGQPRSNLISMMSQLSFNLISAPSKRTGEDNSTWEAIQDLDNTPEALSLFVLETCNRQLRQYHLSTLEEEAVNLNIGEGLDYSVDISKTDEGELVAVKHLKIDAEDQSQDDAGRRISECGRIWKALTEIRIMMHPPIAECINVLSVKGFGWDYVGGKTTTPSLVVEFAEYGTIRHYLKTEPKKSDSERWKILSGISEGLLSLHHCGVIHGDVKMENILVAAMSDGTIIPKIADFGSSVITTSGEEHYSYGGTDIYNPPEVRLSGSGRNSIPRLSLVYCDIWAFGLLSLEVALGGQCYLNEEVSQCLKSLRMEGFEAACLHRLDQAEVDNPAATAKFRTIVETALKRDPNERATSQAVKGYFSDEPEEHNYSDIQT
jgi:serine/threonine protein kinase